MRMSRGIQTVFGALVLLGLTACGGSGVLVETVTDVSGEEGAQENATGEEESSMAEDDVSDTSSVVTTNGQWAPVIEEFDGVPMAMVPAGCFMMGSEDGGDDEVPVHQQCFDEPFWIDVYEVTNAQYGSAAIFSGDRHPRDSVTWFDAVAHCETRGARLPTEAEWEYAARGPDSLIYPWGNEFVDENATYTKNSGNETAPVGSRPGGVSWVGAYDLSGNLWEWVSTLYQAYPYDAADGREVDATTDNASSRVLRGGSWKYPASDQRTTARFGAAPGHTNETRGFRCALSP